MVSSSNQPEQTFARKVASELNQPTRGKGVDRLAADLLNEALAADITEQEAAARLSKLPGARWVYTSVNVGYSIPTVRENFDQIEYVANVDVVDGPTFRESSTIGFLPCVEAIEAKFDEQMKKVAREKGIRARIERELAEIDAAEAALKATAPIPFDDGSGLGLPVIVQESAPLDMSRGLLAGIEKRFTEITGQNLMDSRENPDLDPFDGVTPADGGGMA